MPTRLRIAPLLDIVLIDDPIQVERLDDDPAISRELSPSGGWLHRLLHARIYGTLTVSSAPLPAFARREDPQRALRQEKLERQLSSRAAPSLDADAMRTLARYVAGVDPVVPVGVAVQQLVGRMFLPGYEATPESYAAAKLIDAWPKADPIRALWWRWSGRLRSSKELVWELAENDPQCIHATALAMHNLVGALDRMRALLKDAPQRRRLTPEQAAAASLIAPRMVLRSCIRETRVPFLKRPLYPGTLVIFRLEKMHKGTADSALALARERWNQCPAHDIVPRLLGEIWTAAVEEWAELRYAQRPPSLFVRFLIRGFALLNRIVPWHRMPKWIALLNIGMIRVVLRAHNLRGTTTPPTRVTGCPVAWRPRFWHSRTSDGTYNDLADPAMGSAHSRFGRNVAAAHTRVEPEPALLQPNPRTISRRLMTRRSFIPATTLNVLAAAWIQFQVHDWFSHGSNDKRRPFQIELEPDDDWPERPMRIERTRGDPTGHHDAAAPPTFTNAVTHWWDASQLYGSDLATQHRVRAFNDGKLGVLRSGLLPFDRSTGIEITGVNGNWWVGLSLLHTLFTLEHNAICDRLRAEHPEWDDEQLFQTARLVNAALIAKIHTLEWTPAILAHPAVKTGMRANWWGFVGERLHRLLGRAGEWDVLWGIPGSDTEHHSAPYAMTEEFVAVYRMHPLLPDLYTFHSATGGKSHGARDLAGVSGRQTRALLNDIPMPDLFYSLGIANPGAITLHNYPEGLQRFRRVEDDVLLDVAAVDVLRDRERGVPRYNAFRQLLHLPRVRSFEELSPQWGEELRDVYQHIDRVDLMVGLLAETPPRGSGFSDTAFRIFILMASRRLKSDRFFTTDYTPAVYTQAGLDWIDDNDMKSVVLRHYPVLTPAIQDVANVFAPWDRIAGRP
jgi:hypothetical protein